MTPSTPYLHQPAEQVSSTMSPLLPALVTADKKRMDTNAQGINRVFMIALSVSTMSRISGPKVRNSCT